MPATDVGDGPRTLPVRHLLSGFALLALAQVVSQLIGFYVLALAARELGPENLGPFTWAMGVALYFKLFTDFGVTVLGIRDIARAPERAREIIGEVLILQVALGLFAFGAMIALAPVIAPDQKSEEILPIVAFYVLVFAALAFDWALRALQWMKGVAIAQVTSQIVYGVLVTTLLVGGFEGAKRFAWLTVANAALAALITFALTLRVAGTPRFAFDRGRLWRRLKASLPIGISFAMIQVYYSIDSVLLGYLRDTAEVAQYAVAYRIPLGVFAFAAVWVAVVYPHASAMFVKDPERLRRQVGTFASYSFAMALPLGAGATFAGAALMPKLFGERFEPATTPFILLTWAVAISIVSVNFGNVLLGCGDEKRYAIGVTAGAVVNVALNFALIPPIGTTGAAIATIVAELAVLTYMLRRFRVVLGPVELEWQRIARAGLATLIMSAVLIVLHALDPLALIPIGIVVYVAAAGLLGVVTRAELRDLVRRRRDDGAVATPE
jgi:O-antigen/teichoic acid export membrane protein